MRALHGRVRCDRAAPICNFFFRWLAWRIHQLGAAPGASAATSALFGGQHEHAKQVMAFVLVVLSKPHLPTFVVAAQEHRSSDKGDVAKWEQQSLEAAGSAGMGNFGGFCCDGDSAPRSYCDQSFTAKGCAIPAGCAGVQRGGRFDSIFGRYVELAGGKRSFICFRSDIVHITKKLRNQLLNMVSKTLTIGPWHITLQHIKEVMMGMENVGIKHGISKSAYDVADKQNVRAANELMKRRDLPQLLLKYCGEKATGTALYFEYSSLLIMAYFDTEMSAGERMISAFKAVFFFDYWNEWLQKSGYKRQSSFISDQSHKDLTIAAYALVIDYAANCLDNPCQQFLPCNHNSDKIEHLFGEVRELIPGQRDVNFVDFIARCKRIQVGCQVSHQTDASGAKVFAEKTTKNRQAAAQQQPAAVALKPSTARFWMVSSDLHKPVTVQEATANGLAAGKWVFIWVAETESIELALISHITYSPTTKSAFLRDRWEAGDSANMEVVVTVAEVDGGGCDAEDEAGAEGELYGYYNNGKRKVVKANVGAVVALVPAGDIEAVGGVATRRRLPSDVRRSAHAW